MIANETFYNQFETQNFTIAIHHPEWGYGWFEHNEWGDECGGGLWFEGIPSDEREPFGPTVELVDYDGVMSLPREVALALIEQGIKVEDYCYV